MERPEIRAEDDAAAAVAEKGGNVSAVVGIGASAGGQEAFEKFFAHMPADTGLTFVLVQHLAPDHESMLAELVGRLTQMTVTQIQEGMRATPNCVYVIPPNRELSFMHSTFYLSEPQPVRGLRLPINSFFRSLALDQTHKAIGIILSGAGSDGASGLKAIKEQGGLVIAQDPVTARYDGMPRSAIATGLVDYVLPPEPMPAQVLSYVNHPYLRPDPALGPALPTPSDPLARVIVLLRDRTGHDFSQYKRTTAARRVARRMAINQIEHVEDYARFLQADSREVSVLFRDMLIGVTGFFRDPKAFAALREQVVPQLFENRQPADPLRVWVVGCSTGEEAYSVAILLQEQMDRLERDYKVQVFATDIDGRAIETARRGRYPASIEADVTPERLRRFFARVDDGYQLGEQIRRMVTFAEQSVIKDPPFSRLDLISCRNLLIYLEPVLQRRLIPLFHRALKPGGTLFLGTSESLDGFPELFTTVDRSWRLFRRSGGGESRQAVNDVPPAFWRAAMDHASRAEAGEQAGIRETVEKALLDQAPTSVVVKPDGEIVYIHGRTGKYLELPPGGGASASLLRMAREGLSAPLRAAVYRAATRKEVVSYSDLPVKTDGGTQAVDLVVQPFLESPSRQDLLLVTFVERETSARLPLLSSPAAPEGVGPGSEGGAADARDQRIGDLERELQSTREYLQSTVEALQASNEELQSTNEEMQSANEELESSHEELQSVNEELLMLNAEHEGKIADLVDANADLNNVLARMEVGFIFLDERLYIRRFNAAATRVCNLMPGDVGRPLAHITSNLHDDHLLRDAHEVLDNLAPKEVEVQTKDGRWHWMQVRPYLSAENVVEGVMLTFTDITGPKEVEAELRKVAQAAETGRQRAEAAEMARELAEDVINAVREPLMVLDGDLRVISANRAFYETFHLAPEETEGRLIYELGNREWDIPRLRELLEDVIPREAHFEDFEIDHDFSAIGRQAMLLNARRITRGAGDLPVILLAIEPRRGRRRET